MTWDFDTAARTLWQEARGEVLDGQRAVAHVIVNRLKTRRWGSTLAAVCMWPSQFSGWNNSSESQRVRTAELPDTDPALIHCGAVLQAALSEPDMTNGALYYYAPDLLTQPPFWARTMTHCGRFGTQEFFKPSEPPEPAG